MKNKSPQGEGRRLAVRAVSFARPSEFCRRGKIPLPSRLDGKVGRGSPSVALDLSLLCVSGYAAASSSAASVLLGNVA
jgi:hypothetical protein